MSENSEPTEKYEIVQKSSSSKKPNVVWAKFKKLPIMIKCILVVVVVAIVGLCGAL